MNILDGVTADKDEINLLLGLSSKSGSDATIITGTEGSEDEVAIWNSDGDATSNTSFSYDRGSTTCANATATTAKALTAPGTYLVSCFYAANEASNPYVETAIISVDGTTRNHVDIIQDGRITVISASNLNIQITQNSGVSLLMQWSVPRLI